MIIGTLISYIFDYRNVYQVKVVGKVPTDLPHPILPVFSIVPECLSYAVPITVLTIVIHISMAKVLAQRQKYRIDSGQEIYAISFSSIISSFFPVYPSSNGFGRSFVQAECGAKTQMCSLASCVFLIGVIIFMGPLFMTLPRCVLSTVIIISMRAVLEDVKKIKQFWKLSKIDFVSLHQYSNYRDLYFRVSGLSASLLPSSLTSLMDFSLRSSMHWLQWS